MLMRLILLTSSRDVAVPLTESLTAYSRCSCPFLAFGHHDTMRTRYLGLPGIVGVFVLGVLGNNSSCDVSKVYLLDDHFSGPGFSQNFAWETFNDPTHGRVNVRIDLRAQVNMVLTPLCSMLTWTRRSRRTSRTSPPTSSSCA